MDAKKTKINSLKAYFDNNATTIMPKVVIDEIVAWTNMGNPSADYCNAQRCRTLIQNFREYVAKTGKFKLAIGDENDSVITPEHYRVVITSGASESNSLIVRSVVDSYNLNVGKPHIITSQIEHKSILDTLEQLEKESRATVTYIKPTPLGFILPIDVEVALKANSNTALCTIMAANNETGAINDYAKIAKICHKYNTPFHTDVVQLFGKKIIYPVKEDIDAYSISFHKMHGPIGIGLLIIKEKLFRGYKLCSQIGGTQNSGFRGGTTNTCGVAGAFAAMLHTYQDREKKNESMRNIKRHIIEQISKRMPAEMYREYLLNKSTTKPAMEVVFISTAEEQYLPNTLMFSVVKRTKPDMCNGKLKKHMCDGGIIISIGSACNTDSAKASHVLHSMDVDPYIRRGTIRVSLGDESTMDEANAFVKELILYLNTINN
jgi:cysteine desulfurase